MIRTLFPGRSARDAIETHPERWVRVEDIGTIAFPYRATFPVPGGDPDDGAALGGILARAGIAEPRPEDAKLAELVLRTRRHGIAFGTGTGAAAGIAAAALAARPSTHPLLPLLARLPERLTGLPRRPLFVAVDDGAADAAQDRLARLGLSDRVWFVAQESVPAAVTLIGTGWRFGFCLVDQAWAYAPMAALCRLLPDLLAPGGFLLAAGWLDPRNARGDGAAIGVRAAFDGLDGDAFRFLGSYGRAALYRRA